MIRSVRRGRTAAALLLGLSAATAAGVAAAPAEAGAAPRVVTGGVSEEERDAILRDAASSYNLWLVFAEQGSGHYLANVRVTIADAANRPVVDVVTDGPWLLAQLRPGHYTLRVGNDDVRHVTVGAGRAMTVVRLDEGSIGSGTASSSTGALQWPRARP